MYSFICYRSWSIEHDFPFHSKPSSLSSALRCPTEDWKPTWVRIFCICVVLNGSLIVYADFPFYNRLITTDLLRLIWLARFISSKGARSGTLDTKVLAWLYRLSVFTDDLYDLVAALWARFLFWLFTKSV